MYYEPFRLPFAKLGKKRYNIPILKGVKVVKSISKIVSVKENLTLLTLLKNSNNFKIKLEKLLQVVFIFVTPSQKDRA